MERILVINLGSTSTKLAVFNDEACVMSTTIRHPLEEVKGFRWVMEQFDYRMAHIETALVENGIDKLSITCVMARGGLLPPVPSGAFTINKDMIDYFYAAKVDTHISNLTCVIANAIAAPLGMPELPKKSRGHVLNSRAMAIKCANEKLHKDIEDCTIIVLHIGGGCSAWLSHNGKLIDCYSDDDAGFAPERCGKLQAMDLAMLCYSGKYTKEEMSRYIRGNSGLKAYSGTSDGREIEAMIANGDQNAMQLYEAMALSHAKGIAELAAVVSGKVDMIVITGGLAYSKLLMDLIIPRIEWIAPVSVMAGEYEMEALAAGGLRVLSGKEQAHEFVWKRS